MRLAGIPAFVALACTTVVSAAYDTGSRSTSIFPPGYMSCRQERDIVVRTTESATSGGREVLVPLPRRTSVPAPILLGDDVVDDVAMVEPVPGGRRQADPPKQERSPVLARESVNNYRCLGLVRGRAGILRTIAAPPGTRFYGHPYETSWRIDNMVAASVFHLMETRGALRSVLSRPISDDRSFDKTELRTSAAVALAELEDRPSAPAIAAWTQHLESRTLGFQYRSVIHALERLDPVAAETYVVGLLERVAGGVLGKRVGADRLRAVPMLSVRSREAALPVLRRLTAPGAIDVFDGSTWRCELTAARLRFGDPQLVPLAREQIFGSLTDGQAVNCYTQWLPATIGEDPSDVDALLHRRAYEPMLRFVEHVQSKRGKPGGVTWERAGAALHEGLAKILAQPRMSDRSRNDYFPTHRAMHLAAMAGLADPKARRLLYEMIEDPTDRSDGAWVAAYFALKLCLPGATERVLQRLVLGIGEPPYLASLSFTVGTPTTWRTRVLEELVRALPANDARWTIALLDRELWMREKALYLLSRRKPPGACEAVLGTASKADDERIKQAFWALSILGEACWDSMSRAAGDSSLAPNVRGPAMVLLAMTRSPKARAMVEAVQGEPEFRLYANTSNIILGSPE